MAQISCSKSKKGWPPGRGGGWPGGLGKVQAASTSTISLSSIAVTRSVSISLIAAPSRALTRTPSISIAPVAGTRYALRAAVSGYSALSPAFSVAATTRASVRIGSASPSPS